MSENIAESAERKGWNVRTAFAQIEGCGFECEAGPLSNNDAWIWLKKAADGPLYRLGDRVPHVLKAEVSGFELTRSVSLTIVAIKMSSDSDRRTWVYDLSSDPPDAYHYGSGVTVANVSERDVTRALDAQAGA